MFERQLAEARESGNEEVGERIGACMRKGLGELGRVIWEFERDLDGSRQTRLSSISISGSGSGSSSGRASFSKRIEDAIEKATILQQCEFALLDSFMEEDADREENGDMHMRRRNAERSCREWERIIGDLKQCWAFYREVLESDVVNVERVFEGTWGRALEMVGERYVIG